MKTLLIFESKSEIKISEYLENHENTIYIYISTFVLSFRKSFITSNVKQERMKIIKNPTQGVEEWTIK